MIGYAKMHKIQAKIHGWKWASNSGGALVTGMLPDSFFGMAFAILDIEFSDPGLVLGGMDSGMIPRDLSHNGR